MVFALASRNCVDPRVLPEAERTKSDDQRDWRQAGMDYYQTALS